MIYTTMCIGSHWVNRFSHEINNFGKFNKVIVLTDDVSKFDNCEVIEHNKDLFSYYDKLILLFNVMQDKKERVAYVDADKFSTLPKIEYDNESCYVYNILDKDTFVSILEELDINKLISKINKKINSDFKFTHYLQENLISIPYTNNFLDIKKDIELCKEVVEEYCNQRDWNNFQLKRYSEHGVGYAEGSALTVILSKYNISSKNMYNKFQEKSIL